MPGELVTLTQVETRADMEVLVAMLKAYGIHASSSLLKGRQDFFSVHVAEVQLEDARALLVTVWAGDGTVSR